jgi:Rps23 Pro-64 3,4-dihydroxylase Tpa1-like proline 4-hydroxylase
MEKINKKIDTKGTSSGFQSGDDSNLRYAVIDDLFDSHFIKKCSDEFISIQNSPDFIRYSNKFFEFEKYTMNKRDSMPENLSSLFSFLHSPSFVEKISNITGIANLCVDEDRWGGGLHMTKKGGYLSVHKDFNVLPTSYKDDSQMLRCVNIIGYLNENWKSGDGGELEFWDKDGSQSLVKVEPKYNRWVVFDTRNNFHGHPYPYQGDSPRISIAAYYYIRTSVIEEEWMSTVYLKLPWMDESSEYEKMRGERSNPKLRYTNLLK